MFFFDKVKESSHFTSIFSADVEKSLKRLMTKRAFYRKYDAVWIAGESTKYIGLLVSGSERVYKDGADSSTFILSDVAAPNLKGEIGVWAWLTHYPVSVQANEDCEVLFLERKLELLRLTK